MAIITVTIDTEKQTISGDIDGKKVTDINSASFYAYPDYKGRVDISWNISCSDNTTDDDFRVYTNYCSAAEIQKKVENKTKADISNYFLNKRR